MYPVFYPLYISSINLIAQSRGFHFIIPADCKGIFLTQLLQKRINYLLATILLLT